MFRMLILVALALGSICSVQAAEDRDTKVRRDREVVQAAGQWIYNDLAKGFAEAKATSKPLMVVLRCIP